MDRAARAACASSDALRRRRGGASAPASGCTASRSTTGAPSTSASGALAPRRRQYAADRRHRLGQVDAGRCDHHACWCRRRRSPTTRRPAPMRASATCAPTCSAITSPSAATAGLSAQAGGAARPQQLLGHPRPLPQRGLRPDRHAGPGVLAQGRARPAGRASTSSPTASSRSPSTSPASAATSTQLRKRLRASRDVELFDSFPPYGAAFRRRFGIDNEQAMDLFHQTVSMKSVGNLTDFVREHMLEPFPVEPRIARADRPLRRPEPRARGGAQGEGADRRAGAPRRRLRAPRGAGAQVDELRGCRDALRPWFADLKAAAARQAHRRARQRSSTRSASASRALQRARRERQRDARRNHAGDRRQRRRPHRAAQGRDRAPSGSRQDERRARADEYDALAPAARACPAPRDADTFVANRARHRQRAEAAAARSAATSRTG